MNVSKTQQPSRPNTWRIRWSANRKRQTITWNGSESEAETVRQHVAHLLDCVDTPPHKTTRDWLLSLSNKDHAKISKFDIVEPREAAQAPKTLRDLYDSFRDAHKSKKPSTIDKYRQTFNNLSKFFGEGQRIDTITKADAKAFREWLQLEGNERDNDRTDLDVNTCRRRIGIARQFFKYGIDSKWITDNPFHGIPASVRANPERFYYVTPAEFQRAIDFAPDATMRAIIALNRLIGFRIPSEIRTLTWGDVDLSPNDAHLRIKAPKTEHHHGRGIRTAPILPELRPYLEDLATLAGDVSPDDPVFPRFIDTADSAIRSAVVKILKRAGITRWPNLFSNGRKSAITDLLAAKHDVADVASWVGNSPAVIWEYYAMSKKESRRRAASMQEWAPVPTTTKTGDSKPAGSEACKQPEIDRKHAESRVPHCVPDQPKSEPITVKHNRRKTDKTQTDSCGMLSAPPSSPIAFPALSANHS